MALILANLAAASAASTALIRFYLRSHHDCWLPSASVVAPQNIVKCDKMSEQGLSCGVISKSPIDRRSVASVCLQLATSSAIFPQVYVLQTLYYL